MRTFLIQNVDFLLSYSLNYYVYSSSQPHRNANTLYGAPTSLFAYGKLVAIFLTMKAVALVSQLTTDAVTVVYSRALVHLMPIILIIL